MNILVLGSGGREHAEVLACQTSTLVQKVIFAPGNAGVPGAQRRALNIKDFPAVVRLCKEEDIRLACVGPEQPLCDGLVDYAARRDSSIRFFGPTEAAAELELSKAFMKVVALASKVRTAPYRLAKTMGGVKEALEGKQYPVVMKYNGLAAGKGVEVVANEDEAFEFAARVFITKEGDFAKDQRILVEDFVPGLEVSVFFVCNGKEALFVGDACDYKRALDGDKGKNTGGMGAYSPAAWLTNAQRAEIQSMADRIMQTMRNRNIPYRGIMYLGLKITPQGKIYLLEINCRFGDPEAQVILARLEDGIFVDLMRWSVGVAPKPEVTFKDVCAVYSVLVAKGYPAEYQKNIELGGLASVGSHVTVLHAGTEHASIQGDLQREPKILSTGGRVVGTLGVAQSLTEAREKSQDAAGYIAMINKRLRYRRDIAKDVL